MAHHRALTCLSWVRRIIQAFRLDSVAELVEMGGRRRKILAPLYSRNLREQSNEVQVRGRVELPSGPLIEYLSFCTAIAEALHPTKPRHYQGIGCIVGKMVRCHTQMAPRRPNEKWPLTVEYQAVLVSDGGRTLDQLLPDRPDAGHMRTLDLPLEAGEPRHLVEAALPFPLDDDDQRALQAILPSLPPLQYPISDVDEAAFVDAWAKLTDRPEWMPIFVTPDYIEKIKVLHKKVLDEHRRSLQEEFAHGTLGALNALHGAADVLTTGCFIARKQAIGYLESRGLSYADANRTKDAELSNPSAKFAAECEQNSEPVVGTVGRKEALSEVSRVPGCSRKSNQCDEPTDVDDRNGASLPAIGGGNAPVGKIARLRRVEELTGLKRSSIYNRMNAKSEHFDPTFPRHFALGAGGRAKGWSEEEIKIWVAAQAATRRKQGAE